MDHYYWGIVALLAEGVDRNYCNRLRIVHRVVALLAEGVDRNLLGFYLCLHRIGSPSSRRAWIEIFAGRHGRRQFGVALLAEGVDRNIYTPGEKTGMVLVALLAEGVDRN